MRIQRHTDKYFTRTKTILEKEGLNPLITMVIFARGKGRIAGLSKAARMVKECAQAKILITKDKEYSDMQPLMVIKARVRDIIELETIYLGILSDELSRVNGFSRPKYDEVKQVFQRLSSIFRLPIIYFGARHYLWSLDKEIARAALDGGASQTSTDAGSSNIHKEGVGTMPHLLPVILAKYYGTQNATLKAAGLFDKYMPKDIPRIVLVDTFAREITDSLAVAKYFNGECMVRIDTCSESYGEGQKKGVEYVEGMGVTTSLVRSVRVALDQAGYEHCGIFLSGGFGNISKGKLFMEAYDEHMKKTGRHLFAGLGIGGVSEGIFCTADCIEVDGKKISKAGRNFNIKNMEEFR